MMRWAMPILLAAAFPLSAQAGSAPTYMPIFIPSGPGKKLVCDKRPLEKIYASTKWEVRGCKDDRVVMLLAEKDNPLYPYAFVVRPDVIGWDVFGTPLSDPVAPQRNQKIVDAVRDELEKFHGEQVDALIAESNAAQNDTPTTTTPTDTNEKQEQDVHSR